MRLWLLLSFFTLNSSWAEIGKVIKLAGTNNAYLMRGQDKFSLAPEMLLELGDQISTQNTHVVIHLFPGTQLSLAQNSQIKITEHLIEEEAEAIKKSSSIIDFMKGMIRVNVSREGGEEVNQTVRAEGVSFGVRGTEFEVSQDDSDEVDLDVFEGSVEVTSPHVHTFVPEVVKANEGFKYNKKKRTFARRKFAPKFKNHPGFENNKKLRQQYKELRKQKRAAKLQNKEDRNESKRSVREAKRATRQKMKPARKAKKGSRDK